MARRKIYGTAFHEDTDGKTMITTDFADIYCYEAGSLTAPPGVTDAIDMWNQQTGGTKLWPGGAGVASDGTGYFDFWIDYNEDIRIVIEKLGVPTLDLDDIAVPVSEFNLDLDGGSF